jgi:hypothetical protein
MKLIKIFLERRLKCIGRNEKAVYHQHTSDMTRSNEIKTQWIINYICVISLSLWYGSFIIKLVDIYSNIIVNVVQPTSCLLPATICQPGNYVHRHSYSWSNNQWELKLRNVRSAKSLQLSGTACRTKLIIQRYTEYSSQLFELIHSDWLSNTDHVTDHTHDSSDTRRLEERHKLHLIIIIY